jgi:hypothetical protein
MYIVSGLITGAAVCAEHIAWNGITTVNNEFETVQQNLIYHLSIFLGGLSKTGLQAQISVGPPRYRSRTAKFGSDKLNDERLQNYAIQETNATNM